MTAPRSSFGLPGLSEGLGAFVKAVIPVAGFLLLLPLIWLLFRRWWRELDAEAADHQLQRRATGVHDKRPMAVFAIAALVLTLQEYYGGRDFYRYFIHPALRQLEIAQLTAPGGLGQYVDTRFYGELYGYAWWALTRVVGYTLLPLTAWKILFRRDRLLDMGFHTKGLLHHAWLYGLAMVVVLPPVFIVASQPEFANYYPFYKLCSRSWFELIVWEAMYLAQFFALEVFFRGFMLVPLRRSLGSGAIFAMCVPYVMIHYGKPYHEACGAFVAGTFLGTLSMRTRSIYWGFFAHITVALVMDGFSLATTHGLPDRFWPR